MQWYAEAGMRIAEANRQAYAETYRETVEPANISARDVEMGIVRQTGQDKIRGKRVLDGIRYNIVANNGKDFATFEVLDDLLMLYKAHMRSVEAARDAEAILRIEVAEHLVAADRVLAALAEDEKRERR